MNCKHNRGGICGKRGPCLFPHCEPRPPNIPIEFTQGGPSQSRSAKKTLSERLTGLDETNRIIKEAAERAGQEGNDRFFDRLMSSTTATRSSMLKRAKVHLFVVLVPRPPSVVIDVYGPYKKFEAAEGDAKAWGGTVHPVDPITQGHA